MLKNTEKHMKNAGKEGKKQGKQGEMRRKRRIYKRNKPKDTTLLDRLPLILYRDSGKKFTKEELDKLVDMIKELV